MPHSLLPLLSILTFQNTHSAALGRLLLLPDTTSHEKSQVPHPSPLSSSSHLPLVPPLSPSRCLPALLVHTKTIAAEELKRHFFFFPFNMQNLYHVIEYSPSHRGSITEISGYREVTRRTSKKIPSALVSAILNSNNVR